MTTYRGLLVDFGNVLTTPLHMAMAGFAMSEGVDLAVLANAALGVYMGQEDDLVAGVETGEISLAEFERRFAARLSDATGTPVSPEELVNRMFAGLELELEMLEAVRACRSAGIKTGLLSNSWSLEMYPRAELDAAFDVSVISGEVGLRKPDPAIFALAIERLELTAAECVFIDDDPGHLQVAEDAGMLGILHVTTSRTIEKIEELFEIGLSDS
jgi:epoxide hydrolase-like predicted phosphatase